MEFLEYITYIEYIIFFEDYFKTVNEDLIYNNYHTLQFFFFSKGLKHYDVEFNDFFDCIFFWGNKGYFYNNMGYRTDIFYSNVISDKIIGEKVAFMELESVNNFVGTFFYCKPFKGNTLFCKDVIITFLLGRF